MNKYRIVKDDRYFYVRKHLFLWFWTDASQYYCTLNEADKKIMELRNEENAIQFSNNSHANFVTMHASDGPYITALNARIADLEKELADMKKIYE